MAHNNYDAELTTAFMYVRNLPALLKHKHRSATTAKPGP